MVPTRQNKITILKMLFSLSLGINSMEFADYPLLLGRPYDRAPYHATGTIISPAENIQEGECSGTLIAPDVVLTAAHCLYGSSIKDGKVPEDVIQKWREQLTFSPTMLMPENKATAAKKYIIPKEYVSQIKRDQAKASSFDFAVIILKSPFVGSFATTFTVSHSPPPPNPGKPVFPTFPPSPARPRRELPADLPREADDERVIAGHDIFIAKAEPYVSICPLLTRWARSGQYPVNLFYVYRCSTKPSMSGSPIFFKESDDHYVIIGVHIGSNKIPNILRNTEFNHGTPRVNPWYHLHASRAYPAYGGDFTTSTLVEVDLNPLDLGIQHIF